MKKIFIILVIVAFVVGAWYYDKVRKEKLIFNGKSKREFKRYLKDIWKRKYTEAQTDWMKNGQTRDELAITQAKADENNRTLDEQIAVDVAWLYKNADDVRTPYKSSETWRVNWIVNEVEKLGIDSTDPKVIEVLNSMN